MTRAAGSIAQVRVPRISLFRAALIAALFLPVSASTAPAAGSVSGQITNSVTHVGIAGARVWIFDLNADAEPITVTADGSGNYSQNLPDGSYAVLTQNTQGYINQIWNSISCSAVCDADSLTAVVVSGGAVTGINFALVPGGGRIAGTITSSATGAPIVGALVYFIGPDVDVPFSTAVTDASGHYLSEGGSVSGSVLVVTANGQGYQDESYNNHRCTIEACDPDTVDTVSVTIGVTTNGINFALDPGGRISGTVKDVNNSPLANVEVRTHDSNGNTVDEVVTDGSGNFITTGLATGTYYVATRNSLGLADYLWNNLLCVHDICNDTFGTPVSVTVPSTTNGINFVLPPGKTISGTVTAAAGGAPIEGIFVSLFNASGTFVGGANTDAAGTFTTGAVPPGTYYANVFANGYVTQLYDHFSCASCPATNGTPFVVSSQPVTNINFALLATGTGSITGTVTDGFNGTLPTGLPVQVVNGSGGVVASTTTNSGVYTFNNVPAGSYYVRTNAPASGIPYINQLYNGVNCLNNCSVLTTVGATRVNVSNLATTSGINFTLQRGAVITGTITSVATNGPLSFSGLGAQVFNSTGVSIGTFNVNASGVYTTTGLPAGTYYIRTNNTQTYISQQWQGQSCPQNSCTVTAGTPIVVNGATVSGIDFALLTGGQIRGNVKDAPNGSNLPNVAVQIFSNAGTGVGFVNTDSSGNYTTSGLPAGTYYLRTSTGVLFLPNNTQAAVVDQLYDAMPCVPNCLNPTSGTPVTVATFTITSGKDFVLSRGGVIAGAVIDANTGVGLASIGVQIYTATGAFAKSTTTNAAGGYTVAGLPPGTYFARTSVGGSVFYQDALYKSGLCSNGCTVTSGTPIEVLANLTSNGIDFALSTGAGGIAGTITDKRTAAPLQGILVEIYSAAGVFTKFTATNAAGMFATSGLAPGTYYVRTRQNVPTGHADQLYSNARCVLTCDVTSGTPIVVTSAALTAGIDFALSTGTNNADFDGDGKTDIAIWRPSDGVWYVHNSSTGSLTSLPWGSGAAPYNDVPVPGDYDGDGKTDIAIWRPSDGIWYVHNSSTGSLTSLPWGSGAAPYNDLPVPADYDGDGKTDIAIWRPSDGTWYVHNSSTGSMTSLPWGSGAAPYNDVPVPGDYDGDGKTDIAIWRPSDGIWYVHNSSTGSMTSLPWGSGAAPYNDLPVPADYDGDGKTDIAIWRPSDGIWYVHSSSNGSMTSLPWGSGAAPYNDVPVPGDYDGDGKTDIAIWRPSDGTWYVHNSSTGSMTSLPWGGGAGPYHDLPIPSFWTAKRGRY